MLSGQVKEGGNWHGLFVFTHVLKICG